MTIPVHHAIRRTRIYVVCCARINGCRNERRFDVGFLNRKTPVPKKKLQSDFAIDFCRTLEALNVPMR